jgi:hypothetical protein
VDQDSCLADSGRGPASGPSRSEAGIDRPTTPPKSNQIRRGQRSKTYDLYLLDPDSRVALGWHKFDAASDKAAIELAQPLITQPPVELWQAEKLVRTWEPER